MGGAGVRFLCSCVAARVGPAALPLSFLLLGVLNRLLRCVRVPNLRGIVRSVTRLRVCRVPEPNNRLNNGELPDAPGAK